MVVVVAADELAVAGVVLVRLGRCGRAVRCVAAESGECEGRGLLRGRTAALEFGRRGGGHGGRNLRTTSGQERAGRLEAGAAWLCVRL